MNEKANQDALYELCQFYDTKIRPYISEKPPKLFKFKTFVHGDFHYGNLFFDCSEKDFKSGNFNRVLAIDWQMYGEGYGAAELVYFLGNGVKFEPEIYEKILKEYHAELCAYIPNNGKDYPFEDFENECTILSIFNVVNGLNMVSFTNPKELEQRFETDEKYKGLKHLFINVMANTMSRLVYLVNTKCKNNKF